MTASTQTNKINKPKSKYAYIYFCIGIFLFSRLIVFAAGYVPLMLGFQLLPSSTPLIEDQTYGLLSIWYRWDTGWYIKIATEGYNYIPQSTEQSESYVVFFPLFPLLMSIIGNLTGSSAIAGMIINNIAFLLALILLYQITLQLMGKLVARRSVIYMALFPSSFYFSTAYSEGLTLFLILATVYMALSHRWGLAVLFCAFASSARLIGVLAGIIIILEWLSVHGWTVSRFFQAAYWSKLCQIIWQNWRTIILFMFIPAGLFLYALYLYLLFDDPFAFIKAQAAWGRFMTNPINVLINDIGRVSQGIPIGKHNLLFVDTINIILSIMVYLMLPSIAHRLGFAYALFTALSISLPLTSATESINRYVLLIFPIFMIFGVWGNNTKFDFALKAISILLSILFTVFYINWIFVG